MDPDLEIVPDLAETWDVSPGGDIYTFRLRRDGRFHDGRPVTAHDFKWSLEGAADPATQSPVADTYLGDIVGVRQRLKGEASEIEGVLVVDEHTLQITIDAPKAYFLSKLTYPTAFVLDRENVESSRRWFLSPNGTGPFKLARYLPGQVLELSRNETYHLGAPRLKGVRFLLGGGDPLSMYFNDEIHILELGAAGPEPILEPSHPLRGDLHLTPPRFTVIYIGMNVDQPPFEDPKVRRALNHAIDRDWISNELFDGALQPAKSILPPGFPGHSPDLAGYEHDPEKALGLLKESSYGEDLENFPPVVLTVPGPAGSRLGASLEAILQMWFQNLGIEIEVQFTDLATYLRDVERGRFHMFGGISWIADYPDPENFLDVLFHSESQANYTRYRNPDVDGLLVQARSERDQALRYELYRQAEEAVLRDAPWILLWHGGVEQGLIKPYVKDYFLSALSVPVLRHVYITEE